MRRWVERSSLRRSWLTKRDSTRLEARQDSASLTKGEAITQVLFRSGGG